MKKCRLPCSVYYLLLLPLSHLHPGWRVCVTEKKKNPSARSDDLNFPVACCRFWYHSTRYTYIGRWEDVRGCEKGDTNTIWWYLVSRRLY
ncbi:hypothetical protein F5B17DRAFT_406128 [Nemania serpens]|nr:hypothetical protein F5B17DRAFT_406128 [Nemania serpens]